jgi:peptide/nickel transport system substrate-binding protein
MGLLLVAGLITAGCAGDAGMSGGNSTEAAGLEQATLELGTIAGPDDTPGEPQMGGNLLFGLEAEPEGLDPTRYAFSSSGHFVASAVFDPLITLDEAGKPVPQLAESMTSNDDATVWTIKVRQGVLFHDGTPLTAQIVADNLEAYRNSFITKASLTQVESIEVAGPDEVRVTLAAPFRAFPAAMATQIGYIVAPAMLADPELVNEPIGTGPFVFQSHVANQSWSFTRNDSYWQDGLPYLDAIEFRPIPDNPARMAALDAGDIDALMTRFPASIKQLRESDFKQVENGSGEEEFLLLNTTTPPFDNPIARQAVAYATDRDRWNEEVAGGLSPPVNSLFAPGQPGYLDEDGFPEYDPDKARELVRQYEEETGEPLAFTWLTQADTSTLGESQLLQGMYEDVGMDATFEAMPQINLIARIATGDYEMGRFRLFGQPNPDPDASAFLGSSSVLPAPDISLNFPRFQNAEVDAAIATALASGDPAVRQDAYATVSRVLAEEVPYVWLGRTRWMMAAGERVNGIYAGQNGTVQTIGPKTWLSEIWFSS